VIATCNRLTPRLFPTLASRAQRLHSLRHIFTVVCARVCDALRSRRFFGARRVGRGRRANVSLPNGYAGRMQTLVEWEASLNELQLGQQVACICIYARNVQARKAIAHTLPHARMCGCVDAWMHGARRRLCASG
jgi:hypothetical protein